MPPETGASTKSKPLAFIASPTSRALCDVDGRAIDQQRARLGVWARRRSSNTARTCLAAGSMVMTTSASLTASAAEEAAQQPPSLRLLDRFRHEVEGADLMPRLGEVRRHPAAHVAKADECDLRHATILSVPSSLPGRFLDEGGHAFLLVLGAEQAVEQPALEADALAERDFEGGVDHLLGRDRGERRHRGDRFGGLQRFVEQVGGGHDLGDEARSARPPRRPSSARSGTFPSPWPCRPPRSGAASRPCPA